MLENVVVVGGYRTYIGKENGIYRHIPAEKLGGHILHKLSGDYGAPDLVLAGNAVGAGGNIGRLMALEAGIPEEVPAFTIDSQCSSGMEAIVMAAAKIGSGQQQVVFAGGAESSSTAPRRMVSENHPEYNGEKIYTAAKFSPGEWRQDAMLWGAEKTAKMAGVSRKTLDAWALRSQQLAVKARDTKVFEDVILPLGTEKECDQGIRQTLSKAFLEKIPTLYENGVTTAANACGTQDGAAFVVLCAESYAKKKGWKPWLRFVDMVEVAGNPEMPPLLVNKALDKLFEKTGRKPEEIAAYECNEAFAVIDELFAKKYPACVPAYNACGGALAYGHPYGATGGILTLHLAKRLQQCAEDNVYGVSAIAAAGGQGTAILWKKVCEK